MTAPSVFLYVQHLLGVGHLKRAATLARAMSDAGMVVTLASGGFPASGVDFGSARFVQLPPARTADLGFRRLLDEQQKEVDDGWKARRMQALLGAWRASAAQVLVLELFPFGRRQMRFELLPLLDAAVGGRSRPLIVCSVRDILGGQRSAERQAETLLLFERYFDRVLVHSDPGLVPFERSFPPAPALGRKLAYTGYVVDELPPAGAAGIDEVIVSAGGGAVGAQLLRTAIRSRHMSTLRGLTWRVLGGDNLDEASLLDLRRDAAAAAGSGIIVERARADFGTLLANCRLSISQAGYNTICEAMQARARVVAVPFAEGNEVEQTLRARCFSERGLLQMVEPASLSPLALARAVDQAAARPRPDAVPFDLNGARRSAALVADWAGVAA
jgi:predicted glycosyltransferase